MELGVDGRSGVIALRHVVQEEGLVSENVTVHLPRMEEISAMDPTPRLLNVLKRIVQVCM